MTKDNAFYGFYKSFDDFDQLVDYAKKFPEMPFDERFFKKFFDDRLKELKLNFQMDPAFTNKMAMQLLRLNTDGIAEQDQILHQDAH